MLRANQVIPSTHLTSEYSHPMLSELTNSSEVPLVGLPLVCQQALERGFAKVLTVLCASLSVWESRDKSKRNTNSGEPFLLR